MTKTVFLSAGIGQWYSTGVMRLKGSLIEHGWPHDVQIWRDEWPDNKFPRDSVYTVKAAAFAWALRQGYTTIIWGDASIYALKSPVAFAEQVQRDGYWIGQSGYRASETASDAQLQYFGVSRDWADAVHDCATGIFGVNVEDATMRGVIDTWIKAGLDGLFGGSRLHANQSKDPRFKFCRQDQSAMSLALGKAGVPLKTFASHCRFAWDRYETTFHCQGL